MGFIRYMTVIIKYIEAQSDWWLFTVKVKVSMFVKPLNSHVGADIEVKASLFNILCSF